MEAAVNKTDALKRQIAIAENELAELRARLQDLESTTLDEARSNDGTVAGQKSNSAWKWPLHEDEYTRYARQLILPFIGIAGQLRLRSASVLVIGAGGLGCPAAAYLAGAGVGKLGVVDGDIVEESNLHRQIAHSTGKVGMRKVESLVEYCHALNPGVRYESYADHLTPANAEQIIANYDMVLDCTDHPTSRYLISDICVLLQKPLVSASALRADGQLIVLNNPPAAQGNLEGGPCYRCVFPKPPPPETLVSCGEGGILGPVVGVMGVLQALETIKLVAGAVDSPPNPPHLLLFSASGQTTFRSIRMRGRRPQCFACSASSTLSVDLLKAGSVDYVEFCGVAAPIRVLQPEERITALAYDDIRRLGRNRVHVLLDVREPVYFAIGSIPGAINVPFSSLQAQSADAARELLQKQLPVALPPDAPIYVICRIGNDSQLVAQKLKQIGLDLDGVRFIGDITGGMRAWKHDIDPTLPFI